MRSHVNLLIAIAIAAVVALPQDRVAPDNLGERVIAAVPWVGSGGAKDPKRPLFVANPSESGSETVTDLSYTILGVSDDGKSAIVEFSASDVKTLEPILKAQRSDVKAFRKGHVSKTEIEQAMKQFKRDFSADQGVIKR